MLQRLRIWSRSRRCLLRRRDVSERQVDVEPELSGIRGTPLRTGEWSQMAKAHIPLNRLAPLGVDLANHLRFGVGAEAMAGGS